MMKKRTILSVLSLILSVSFIHAQHDNWENYTNSDEIDEIISYEGDILFGGTGSGLIRYNPNNYTTTIYNKANSGIISNVISCLENDGQGGVWIGSMVYLGSYFSGGLCHFDGTNWQSWYAETSGLPSNEVQGLAMHTDGKLWIATRRDGIAVFDGTNWFVHDENNSPIEGGTEIDIQSDGTVWVGLDNLGLAKFDGNNWEVLTTENSELPSNDVLDIAVDENDIVWIGTFGGLVRIDQEDNWQIYNEDNSGISSNGVNHIHCTGNGVWLAMNTGGGVCHFENDEWTVYKSGNTGLSTNWNNCIFRDKYGVVWVGSFHKGVDSFDGENWRNYLHTFGKIPDFVIKDLAIGTDARVWIATYGGLVEKNGNWWRYYDTDNSPLNDDFITSVVTDAYGQCWVANSAFGLFLHNGSELIDYTNTHPIFGTKNIEVLDMLGDDLWVGFYADKGILVYNGSSWTHYNSDNTGVDLEYINGFEADQYGAMWIASERGLTVRYANGQWQEWNPINSSLPNTDVYDIAIDENNNKWLGTEDGLIKFDGSSFTIYDTTNSGIVDENVFSVKIDNDGKLWMGTAFGISTFDGTNWETINDENTGLSGSTIADVEIDAKQNKWFCSSANGVAVFNENGIGGLGFGEGLGSLKQELSLSPNPANEYIVLHYSLDQSSAVYVTVFDNSGRLVYSDNLGAQNKGDHELRIETKELKNGIYVCNIITDDHIYSAKVVIR